MIRFLLLVLFIPLWSSAQTHKFFIRFTDKNQTPYSVGSPQQFLSQRAIDRRLKQNIAITTEDLPVDPVYVSGVSALGATVFGRSKWFNGITVECDSSVLSQILQLPYVQAASNVFRVAAPVNDKFSRVAAPVASHSPYSVINYGRAFNQIHLMNGEYLHEQGAKGEGILIAVLDAGFYRTDQHPAFTSVMNSNRILAVRDFVENDSAVFDQGTHGTSVLSCIGANIPGTIVGTAPGASFLLLRSEDEFSENIVEEYNWNAAAEYADSAGADIITSSLGYTEYDNPAMNHMYSDMDGDHCPVTIAADIAASKGMLVINSAGNSGNSQWHYIGAPADGDSVLAVGAVDSLGHFASFSSWGPAFDGAVKPNVAAKGKLSTVANPNDPFGGISQSNGTSFACPILAGSAACLWQMFPDLSAWTIKTTIEKSANYYSAPNDSLGYGIPDFRLAYNLLKYGALPAEDSPVSIYPSPFDDHLSMQFFSATTQDLQIDIFNSIGQSVYSQIHKADGGYYNNYTLNFAEGLQPGIYIVRVKSEREEFFLKTVKVE